jgi:hypothetical protein
MWDPQHLTTVYASTACYGDSFTFCFKIFEAEVNLGLAVSRSWWRPPIRSLWPDFFMLSDNCGFHDAEHPLWRGDGSVILLVQLFLDSPAQSLSGPRPAELTTIFCSLIWDSSNLEGQVPVFISPRNIVAQFCPAGTGFAFRRFLRLAGLRGGILTRLYTALKYLFLIFYIYLLVRFARHVAGMGENRIAWESQRERDH